MCKADIVVKKVNKPPDKYIVLGTDGLWQIVEAVEVISLIEKSLMPDGSANTKYLEKSSQATHAMIIPKEDTKKGIFPKDLNIAKILAAHAKYRWAYLSSRHKVKMDDICVVVIGIV